MSFNKLLFFSLIDNDQIIKSDAIFLFQGDGLNRIAHSIDLYKSGLASKIVYTGGANNNKYGSFSFDKCIPEFEKYNFNIKNLILDQKSLNTYDQAKYLCKKCIDENWKKIILVASHYHQYRAFLTVLNELNKRKNLKNKLIISNSSVRNLKWFKSDGWGERYKLFQDELIRIKKYKVKNHVSSYKEGINYFKWKESYLNDGNN